jgi:hypothetical protein
MISVQWAKDGKRRKRLACQRVIGGTEAQPMSIRILPNGARKAITRLRPYPSLLLLVVPLAVVEPLKLAAVFLAGDGHFITGTFVIVCAYAVSLFLTERLFVIVQPKLMKLSWFAAIWRPFVRVRNRALRWAVSFLPRRRTGLWQWEDGQ